MPVSTSVNSLLSVAEGEQGRRGGGLSRSPPVAGGSALPQTQLLWLSPRQGGGGVEGQPCLGRKCFFPEGFGALWTDVAEPCEVISYVSQNGGFPEMEQLWSSELAQCHGEIGVQAHF